jgi:hypothetical protein
VLKRGHQEKRRSPWLKPANGTPTPPLSGKVPAGTRELKSRAEEGARGKGRVVERTVNFGDAGTEDGGGEGHQREEAHHSEQDRLHLHHLDLKLN